MVWHYCRADESSPAEVFQVRQVDDSASIESYVVDMEDFERAAQVYSVLAYASSQQRLISYERLEALIGVPARGFGRSLDILQQYCIRHELPRLTSLVIIQATGRPGEGYIPTPGSTLEADQARTFVFDWIGRAAPTLGDLEAIRNGI
jgi:hypothetical protein